MDLLRTEIKLGAGTVGYSGLRTLQTGTCPLSWYRCRRVGNGQEFDSNRSREAANVSVLWIQRLETNQPHTNYTIRRLDQVARALGIELYDLNKRVDDMIGPPPWLETGGTQNDE